MGSGGQITYRLATADDVNVLANLRAAFLAEVADADLSDGSVESNLRNWFSEKVPTGHFTAILALAGDEVIASSGLIVHEHAPGVKNPSGREAYIMNMYTVPSWRGKGIATTIFRKLLDVARDKGCRSVTLHALPLARPIYEEQGFAPDDTAMRRDL